MKIYFAAAVRGGIEDNQIHFDIVAQLKKYGVVLSEHFGDPKLLQFGEIGLQDTEIHERDMGWIHEADVIVAEVSQPSLGVGYQVAKGEDLGKRVLCLYRNGSPKKLSAIIAGSDQTEVLYYSEIEDLAPLLESVFKNL